MDIQKSNLGYPKFSMTFRYPNVFLDIQKRIMDIRKSIYGYPKKHFWISKNKNELWTSKNELWIP